MAWQSMKLDLDRISRHIVFLHGPSGGGKSVLQAAIESLSVGRKHPIYLSSGDCFRALDPKDPKMAWIIKEMNSGKFAGTLDATMPKLEQTIGQFIDEIFSHDTPYMPVFIGDGFLRRGEYKVDGKTIPSQVDQVAGAFKRVILAKVTKEDSGFDPELVSRMQEIGTGGAGEADITSVFSDMIRNANHLYIDVKSKDAEALMRIRSEKELTKLAGRVEGRKGNLGKLSKLINEAILIQKGKFIPKSKYSKKVGISTESTRDYTLKPIPERYKKSLDGRMVEIINEVQGMAHWKKDEKPSFSGAVKKLIKGKNVNMEGVSIPRDDDLTHERRGKRIDEFQNLAIEGILKGELGFEEKGEILVPTVIERQATILNGPSHKISLDDLKDSCRDAAFGMIKEMDPKPTSIEGRVFSKERR